MPGLSLKMAGFDDKDTPKPYSEKKWFKDEDGEQITNGYTLRGRYDLKRAVEGLKETLKKSVST